jgi:hypothetical protein
MKYSRRPKGPIKRKKLKEVKGDFLEAHKEVNFIYGDPDSYESRRKQKLIAREVMAVSPATPEYLKCFDPFTFDCGGRLYTKAGAVSSHSLPHHQGCQAQSNPHRWR